MTDWLALEETEPLPADVPEEETDPVDVLETLDELETVLVPLEEKVPIPEAEEETVSRLVFVAVGVRDMSPVGLEDSDETADWVLETVARPLNEAFGEREEETDDVLVAEDRVV